MWFLYISPTGKGLSECTIITLLFQDTQVRIPIVGLQEVIQSKLVNMSFLTYQRQNLNLQSIMGELRKGQATSGAPLFLSFIVFLNENTSLTENQPR